MAKMQSRYNRIDVAHEKCNQCKVEIFEKVIHMVMEVAFGLQAIYKIALNC